MLSEARSERKDRLVAWLQFPRRAVLLLAAFGLVWLLLPALRRPLHELALQVPALRVIPGGAEPDWSVSWGIVPGHPVEEIVRAILPNTLELIGAALLLALAGTLVGSLVALLIHRVEHSAAGPIGSILKGVGRLLAFALGTAPAMGLGLLLIYVFAYQLRWLPAGGVILDQGPGAGSLTDRLTHLILPALVLSLLPGLLTAQAVAREITLPGSRPAGRLWLTGLFKALGTLLGQVGGLLSMAVLVEIVFGRKGIGQLVYHALNVRDPPVVLYLLRIFVLLILAGRLAAELFHGLERLTRTEPAEPIPSPSPWRRLARTLYVVSALALLLVPLGIAAAGLATSDEAVLGIDIPNAQAPPSPEQPWGTDTIGRDIRARVLRGTLNSLGVAGIAAGMALLPAILLGALSAFLASRRQLWRESLSDLLLFPADVLLFIPALPGALLLVPFLRSVRQSGPVNVWNPLTWLGIMLVVAMVLWPRLARACRTLWQRAFVDRRGWPAIAAGPAALLLASLFAGFSLLAVVDWLGMGILPPLPSLGNMLNEAWADFWLRPAALLAPGLALWACTLALYTAGDALLGYFASKEPLARLNE